jgi:hypothetical protein
MVCGDGRRAIAEVYIGRGSRGKARSGVRVVVPGKGKISLGRRHPDRTGRSNGTARMSPSEQDVGQRRVVVVEVRVNGSE